MKIYIAMAGLLLGVSGVVILMRRIHLFLVGTRAPAVFSKWEMRGLSRPAHHPVVRFTARDGREYEVTSLTGRRRPPEAHGKYEVIYPPHAPERALVYSFTAYWLAPFAFFLLSSAALYAAFDLHK